MHKRVIQGHIPVRPWTTRDTFWWYQMPSSLSFVSNVPTLTQLPAQPLGAPTHRYQTPSQSSYLISLLMVFNIDIYVSIFSKSILICFLGFCVIFASSEVSIGTKYGRQSINGHPCSNFNKLFFCYRHNQKFSFLYWDSDLSSPNNNPWNLKIVLRLREAMVKSIFKPFSKF